MPPSNTVTLDMVLAARDARAQMQRLLLCEHPAAVPVCLLVNTPGPVKRLPQADAVFDAGVTALHKALQAACMREAYCALRALPTGCEAYLAVEADGARVKALTCRLEETLAYGRLLDIDVIGADGRPLSRTALGFAPRNCMVCGKPGVDCASRRLHPLPEILAAFDRLAARVQEELP